MNKSVLKKIYFEILKIRLTEKYISDKYHEQIMRCPVHLSIGQEGPAVGICLNLNKSDQISSNHRCHAHYLAKGGSIYKMFCELMGLKNGPSGGRGGSMHLFDDRNGVLTSVPIVGSSIPVGAGAGLYFKYKKKNNISVIFFGDAATEEGVYYETLNYCKVLDLPVLLVCENNSFSCYTHISQRQPKDLIEKIAQSFEIKTTILNGNDTEKIYLKSKKIIKEIKVQKSPQILILNTFRTLEHCGPNNDDFLNYRNKKDVNFWKKNCPLKKIENKIIRKNILTLKFINNYKSNFLKFLNRQFIKAKNSKKPNSNLKKIKLYA